MRIQHDVFRQRYRWCVLPQYGGWTWLGQSKTADPQCTGSPTIIRSSTPLAASAINAPIGHTRCLFSQGTTCSQTSHFAHRLSWPWASFQKTYPSSSKKNEETQQL